MHERALKQFLALADTLHFGRAAEACHLSPSALSRGIQNLEQELGAELFYRDNRHVSLTAAGQHFLPHAQQLLDQWLSARQTVTAANTDLEGELNLYCSVTASYSFLYQLLDNFRAKQPKVEFKLNTGDPESGIGQVQSQAADIAIAARPPRLPRDVSFRPMTTTPLRLICPAAAEASFYRSSKRFWQTTPMVMPMAGLGQKLTEEWLKRTKLSPRVYARVAGNEAIVSMVSLGFGAGVVPEIVLQNSPLRDSVASLEPSLEVGSYEVGLFALKRRLSEPLVESFWQAQ